MRVPLRSVAIAALLLPVACHARSEEFSGRVVGVSDGDTITVLVKRGPRLSPVKVRLHGIDCPESSQPYGTRAKQFTSAACFGKQARVDVLDTDKYGRTVAVVTVGDSNLNEALLSAGLAWWYRQYAPGDRGLAKLESRARAARHGLWADKAPTPPWEFRHPRPAPPKTQAHGDGGRAPSTATHALPSGTDVDRLVYGTRTGSKYHRAGCRYLSRSQIPLALSAARARSLGPCSVCNP